MRTKCPDNDECKPSALQKERLKKVHILVVLLAEFPGALFSDTLSKRPWSCTPLVQQINFGHPHPPRKIIPKCPFGIPRMNFPEWISRNSLDWHFSWHSYVVYQETLSFPEFSGITLERVLGCPDRVFGRGWRWYVVDPCEALQNGRCYKITCEPTSCVMPQVCTLLKWVI